MSADNGAARACCSPSWLAVSRRVVQMISFTSGPDGLPNQGSSATWEAVHCVLSEECALCGQYSERLTLGACAASSLQ